MPDDGYTCALCGQPTRVDSKYDRRKHLHPPKHFLLKKNDPIDEKEESKQDRMDRLTYRDRNNDEKPD